MTSEPIKISNGDVNLEETRKNSKRLSEVKISQTQQTNGNTRCGLITFEGLGLGNLDPIPPMNLGFTTASFGSSWISLTSGFYSNEPSPPTIADIYYANSGDILLSYPVSSVSLYYASYTDITVEAYDINGHLLTSVTEPGNFQPDGYSKWDPIAIDLGANEIYKISIIGASDETAIDNMQLCITLTRGINFRY